MDKYTIRQQMLSKLLNRRGDCYRLSCDTGIPNTALYEWMHEMNGRRLGDEQLDMLARARGMTWVLAPMVAGTVPEPPPKKRKKKKQYAPDESTFPH